MEASQKLGKLEAYITEDFPNFQSLKVFGRLTAA